MYKIYLDQKDYIRIAWGLLGNDKFEADARAYEYLLKQIDEAKVKIFYSSVHFEEVADYVKEGTPQFEIYINVMQTLTRGNCIISFQDLLKREISLYIAKTYGFDSGISESDYPYGMHSEAIIADISPDYDFGRPSNRKQRKAREKELLKLDVEQLSKMFPGSEYMTKSELMNALTGSNSDINRVKNIRKYFDGTMQIERYLKKYRNVFAKKLSIENDKQAGTLLEFIADHRAQIAKENGSELSDNDTRKLTMDTVFRNDDIKLHIQKICQNQKLKFEDVYSSVLKTDSRQFLSLECIILILIEYFKKHKDNRKPDKNDFHDVNHMKFLPYVDIYVCERFFAELSRNIADNFKTIVLRSLKELAAYLEDQEKHRATV